MNRLSEIFSTFALSRVVNSDCSNTATWLKAD
jgi:hypothetical protein